MWDTWDYVQAGCVLLVLGVAVFGLSVLWWARSYPKLYEGIYNGKDYVVVAEWLHYGKWKFKLVANSKAHGMHGWLVETPSGCLDDADGGAEMLVRLCHRPTLEALLGRPMLEGETLLINFELMTKDMTDADATRY